MNSANWIGRNVSRLLPTASSRQKKADAQDTRAQAAIKSGVFSDWPDDAHLPTFERPAPGPSLRLRRGFGTRRILL